MARKKEHPVSIPSIAQIELERERIKYRRRYRRALRSTIAVLVVVAALAVLIASLILPILQVSGTSMEPTLEDGNIIVLMKRSDFDTGDLVGLYHSGKVLLKRVIAGAGDWVDIDADGTVYVNNTKLSEPYITEKSLGECDIRFPFQVPDGSWFVLGDHRSTSIDSRSTAVGCIAQDDMIGKVVLRVWPLKRFSLVE